MSADRQKQRRLQTWIIGILCSLFWITCHAGVKADEVKTVEVNKTYIVQELSEGEAKVDVQFTLPGKGRFRAMIQNCVNPGGYSVAYPDGEQVMIGGKAFTAPPVEKYLGTESLETNYQSVDPGTYVLRLSVSEINSEAIFQIKFEPEGTYQGEAEGNDSFQSAGLIQPNTRYQGGYSRSGDVDYGYFELSAPSKVEISVQGKSREGHVKTFLYRELGNGNMEELDSTGNEYEKLAVFRLPKGKYYLRVEPGWWRENYHEYETMVQVTQESPDLFEQETNDLSSQANEKKVNQWYTGNINRYESAKKDVDWFRFQVPVRSYLKTELKVPREREGNVSVTLYDAALGKKASVGSDDYGSDIYQEAAEVIAEPGTYYLCVEKKGDFFCDWEYAVRLGQREYIPLKGIRLPASKQMTVNQADVLNPTFVPADSTEKEVTWKSSNSRVVTVDKKGRISAKKEGTAVITVTSKQDPEIFDQCRIKVVKAGSSQVKLNKTKAQIQAAEGVQLKLTGTSGKVIWKSGNPSIASVSSKGKVKGKKVGKTTISAKAGGKTYRCTITVTPRKQKLVSAKNQKAKAVTLKWIKQSEAKGYQIQYSMDKRFKKGVKTVTIKNPKIYKKEIAKLKKGKTYYFRVRSYGVYQGRKYYGAYSNGVKVTIRR